MNLTLVDPGLFGLFLLAAVVIFVTPGPDMMYVLAHALSMGARIGIVASLGLAMGMLVHTTAAALGVAALLRGARVPSHTARYPAAPYLPYLGVRTCLPPRAAHHLDPAERVPARTVL